MKGSKIAPWISVFAGLLWFYAAVKTDERRTLAICLGVVFLLIGVVQFRVNRERFKVEENPSQDESVK